MACLAAAGFVCNPASLLTRCTVVIVLCSRSVSFSPSTAFTFCAAWLMSAVRYSTTPTRTTARLKTTEKDTGSACFHQ